jgi:hypothetical protein
MQSKPVSRAVGGVCAALALLSMSGAAWAFWPSSKVDAEVRMPPKSVEAASLRRIAVVSFGGDDGRTFADQLRAELQGAAIDGVSYFTVVNNEALAASAGIGGSSAQTITRLAGLGSQSGVDAVYYGTAAADVNTSSTREEKTRCVEYEGFLNCKREEKYTATCYKLAASYSVTPQVVNVTTGTVAYSQVLAASSEYSYCDDSKPTNNKDAMIAALRADVARQLRKAVAPYNETISLKYKSSAPDLADKALAQRFKDAAAFAKAKQVDRACAMWRELAPGDETTSLALLYNLGVCAEVVADYGRAVALFARAEAAQTKPDKDIYEARQRAQAALARERSVNALAN